MNTYYLIAFIVAGLVLGFLAAYLIFRGDRKIDKIDGEIIIEDSEDGEREVFRFDLGLSLDELEKRNYICLKITNKLS